MFAQNQIMNEHTNYISSKIKDKDEYLEFYKSHRNNLKQQMHQIDQNLENRNQEFESEEEKLKTQIEEIERRMEESK